jgi:hypothetical protein
MALPGRDFLLSEVDKRIKTYTEKAGQNRWYAMVATLVTAGLGALTTIILGINADHPSTLLNTIALVLSALVTFQHALTSFFNNKEFWIEFNEKANDLRKLKFDIRMEEAEHGDLSPQKLAEFKASYQVIVDSMNSFWRFSRSKKESPPKGEGA